MEELDLDQLIEKLQELRKEHGNIAVRAAKSHDY